MFSEAGMYVIYRRIEALPSSTPELQGRGHVRIGSRLEACFHADEHKTT
jgi:hypothetical protein